ncbi:metallophosphoesterase family protein [Couchioplanes azureus]|uniref:metallophosphoesterase family protein n=1 Tax=Couchioplanes caeruleus TaxID=56438 RepID=UPI001670AB04|nr:metallophosphoesterase [Couchioplanes caeruleus]
MKNRLSQLAAAVLRVWRHSWAHRLRVWAAVLLVSLTGVVVGTMLLAQSEIPVGPFRADMSISPSVKGGTEVDIPPLGSLHLDSHAGPIHLKVNLGALDQQRTEALIEDPTAIGVVGQSAVDDVTRGVLQLSLRAMGAAIACALVLAALIFRNVRRVASAGVIALIVTGGSLGLAAGTTRPDSIGEPRYEGLLVNAPAVVGDARRIADNYGRYADQLAELVSNVSRIYTTVSSLPVEPSGNTTRILHVSDLHLNPAAWNVIKTVVKAWDVDAIVDTGDIVDWGSSAETTYVNSIGQLGVPYIYVRGNHDSMAIQAAVARQKNAKVLDNSTVTINGLTLAGIGDPEFTPDKSETPPARSADEPVTNPLLASGERLATTITQSRTKVGVALVHDPAMAPPLSGVVPVVLAGHLHKREVSMLDPPSAPEDAASRSPTPSPAAPTPRTRLLVEGSTGGAGLRGLEKEEPTPLQMSVLYFDENQTLKAYDDIQLGGTGQSNVEMQRKVIGVDPEPTTHPSVVNGVTPGLSPSRR